MIFPPLPHLRIGIAAGALVMAVGGGYTLRGVKADRDISALRLAHTAALLDAERKVTDHQAQVAAASDRLVALAQETTDALQTTQARLARTAADLAGARDRVRDAWAASAVGRCPDPGNPAAVAAAESADLVRADVFRSATARATELAGAVDEQHAYGSACAARYRQVSEALRLLRER